MRLWLRDGPGNIESHLVDFLKVMTARAESKISIDYFMLSYTHLQLAQPIRWGQCILSYAIVFSSDLERLRKVLVRVNQNISAIPDCHLSYGTDPVWSTRSWRPFWKLLRC
jgi:argininosuccinate lyase